MTIDQATISRQPEPIVTNFELLRREGILHLEQLATHIWTDFNAHDPGITILEVLCYALTDLGYRVSFPLEDLLTNEAGNFDGIFFPADAALSNCPVTELDFRKLIIDVPGVKNAWLEKAEGEYPIYWAKSGDKYQRQFPITDEKPICDNPFKLLKKDEADTEKDELIHLNGLYNICLDLHDPTLTPESSKAKRLLKKVEKRLHAYRNLCEDFVSFQIVEAQPICICLHLELAEETDSQQIMAKALFRLQEFLTPTLQFHTLQQLFEKGKCGDEIYDGPILENGFLNDEEVQNAVLRKKIFISDLYDVLGDIPEIISVRELKLDVDGEGFKADYCFDIGKEGEKLKPVIDLCCKENGLIVTKNGICQKLDGHDLVSLIEFKKLVHSDISDSELEELPIPKGTYRSDLADYTSIQEDFPRNYALGENELPESVGSERLAQVKQLQGYLLFFDQLLANYLQQLSQVRELFAVDREADSETVFVQALQQVDGIEYLLKDTSEETLLNIFTGGSDGEARKNQVLNHLLARFGEKFTAYSLHLFQATNDDEASSYENYLQHKSDYLKQIPTLISHRAKAYNCKLFNRATGQPDVWNTENVSGLKRKICGLLGLPAKTASIFCDPAYRVKMERDYSRERSAYFLQLVELNPDTNTEKRVLLTSENSYRKTTAKKWLDFLEENVGIEANLTTESSDGEDNPDQVVYTLKNKSNRSIKLVSETLPTGEVNALKTEIEALFNTDDCENEGFHLIEHILLRPNDKEDELLLPPTTCLEGQPPIDPYSFYISLILPAWTPRFQDADFRYSLEQLVLKHTPAHIAVCFRWIDEEHKGWLRQFENAFEEWREAKANCTPEECEATEKANSVIELLNQMPCPCCCNPKEDTESNCGCEEKVEGVEIIE